MCPLCRTKSFQNIGRVDHASCTRKAESSNYKIYTVDERYIQFLPKQEKNREKLDCRKIELKVFGEMLCMLVGARDMGGSTPCARLAGETVRTSDFQN
jgi:hypothetical protein